MLNDFGGKGKAFTNVYPIRYPGTWDTNAEQREQEDPEKWVRARKAFLESEMVRTYVRDPATRWDAAMQDDDGGQSLISGGIRAVTSADDKQDQLQKEIAEVQNRLLQLSRGWVVDPDTNIDREKRLIAAQQGPRLADLRRRAGLPARPRPAGIAVRGRRRRAADGRLRRDPEPAARRPAAPRSCRTSCTNGPPWPCPSAGKPSATSTSEGEPWLDPDDLNTFTRYLRDYLLTDKVFGQLVGVLQPVVNLKTRDEAARRRARRKYVRIILNDYIMNPGPSRAPHLRRGRRGRPRKATATRTSSASA